MPASEADEVPGAGLAVAAESLYLVNLLLAPGLAFAVLVWLYLRRVNTAPPLARCHLRQTLSASLWAGVLLIAANAVIIVLGGYTAPYTWVVAVLYFLCCHAALVMFGALGLAKALAGKSYRYPLIGRACPEFA
jgi:uncharacterized Tic20 family protein